jgi:hypothetical protein
MRLYRDDGCEVWHACLSCPLPRCIYEEPRRTTSQLTAKRTRNAEIARLSRDGWSARELAARFGLTRRHIFRIRKQERQAATRRRGAAR